MENRVQDTKSDPLADDICLECPQCHDFIDDEELGKIEPDVGFQEITCPRCKQSILVQLEVQTIYTATTNRTPKIMSSNKEKALKQLEKRRKTAPQNRQRFPLCRIVNDFLLPWVWTCF